MTVGLEVFDNNGNKILGMDKSVLRIAKVFKNKTEIKQFLSNNPQKARYLLISSYVDLDKDRDTDLYVGNAVLQQFLEYSDTALLLEMNKWE